MTDSIRDALRAAYLAGAEAVHDAWVNCGGHSPGGRDDLGEGASDYAASVELQAARAPVGEELREKVARAIMEDDGCGLTYECQRVFCDDSRLPADVRHSKCACNSGADAALSAIRQHEDG
jgi:hypothetical protein